MGHGGIGARILNFQFKILDFKLISKWYLMSKYTTVAQTEEIPVGGRKRIEINGQRISIFNIASEYFAIYDTCPHKGTAPLIRGKLDGLGIKCPNHGYRFDLKTGKCNINPVFNTKVFSIKVEDDKILLKLD